MWELINETVVALSDFEITPERNSEHRSLDITLYMYMWWV